MIYKKFEDEALATTIENELVEIIISGLDMTPSKREAYFEIKFKEIKEALKIPAIGEEDVVYTNINPYKRLFIERNRDVLLKAQKESLPICGDGYFALLTRHPRKLKTYAINNSYLPTTEQSIINLGCESFIFQIDTPAKSELYRKCYGEGFNYEKDHVEALINVFMDPKFDFTNIKSWIERAVATERVADASLRIINYNKESTERISLKNDDPFSNLHGKLLLALLCDQKVKYSVFRTMIDLPITQTTEDRLSNLALKVRAGCESLIEAFPEHSKYLRGDFLSMSLDMNFGFEGNDIFRDKLSKLYTPDELVGCIRKSQVLRISKSLDMPELLKEASKNQKREHILNHLNI